MNKVTYEGVCPHCGTPVSVVRDDSSWYGIIPYGFWAQCPYQANDNTLEVFVKRTTVGGKDSYIAALEDRVTRLEQKLAKPRTATIDNYASKAYLAEFVRNQYPRLCGCCP